MTSATLAMYGIRNCDTVKRARAWLDAQGLQYTFHDYKTEGADPVRLRQWCVELGWETLLNRSGTTFRKLPEAQKQGLDLEKALALMVQQPSMIKRPVIDTGVRRIVGFDADRYSRELG